MSDPSETFRSDQAAAAAEAESREATQWENAMAAHAVNVAHSWSLVARNHALGHLWGSIARLLSIATLTAFAFALVALVKWVA